METFLSSIFAIDVKIREFNDFSNLSRLLIDKYRYNLVELSGTKFLSITPLYDLPTIPTLAKQMKIIQKAKGLPVVCHPKSLTPSKMKGLMKHQIPFIVDMKQVYLPFLGTYLQAVAEREVNASDVLSLPAQLLAMMYLYTNENYLYIKQAVKFLPYSAMSITRAVRELEATDLFYVSKQKQSNILHSQLSKRELFDELFDSFASPIWKSGYINNEDITQAMVLAGEDALAEKSMLANVLPVKYAIYRKYFDESLLKRELIDAQKQSELQLWSYEPLLFSQSNIPDPISIILSLKNVHDERVEQAIDILMDEVWEGQHGTWIKQF